MAELSDGSLHMATRFIKAAGGCSAPMVKSMDEALATLGQMKFRILPPAPEAPNEALLMIRHPNNSGLQMDQVTRLYTPARYVDKLAVYQGNDLAFSMEGGISISEDPNFRFTFHPNGAATFRAEGEDNTGKTFSGVLGGGARPRLRGAAAGFGLAPHFSGAAGETPALRRGGARLSPRKGKGRSWRSIGQRSSAHAAPLSDFRQRRT